MEGFDDEAEEVDADADVDVDDAVGRLSTFCPTPKKLRTEWPDEIRKKFWLEKEL